MSDDIVSKARDAVARYGLLSAGERVLVAVSGGPDSMALLYVLARELNELKLGLHVGHVNHGLRGAESDGDEAYVRRVARRLELPLLSARVDVRSAVKQIGAGLEDAARTLRLEALQEMRRQAGAAAIALGHTADDRAETLLLNLLRGAGARGLSAMRPRRDAVIRPLILARRQETLAYCRRLGLRPRRDSSNLSATFARNRVRHEALPLLSDVAGRDVVPVLCRTAEVLAGDEELLADLVRQAESRLITERDDGQVALDVVALEAEPVPLRRRLVRGLLRSFSAELRDVAFGHVEAVLQLASEPGGGALQLPGGLRVERAGRTLRLRRTGPRGDEPGAVCDDAVLAVPGVACHDASGITVTARLVKAPVNRSAGSGGEAFVGVGVAEPALVVRSWRPGDRFRPLGMRGSKKLQDYFVDEKVPRAKRVLVPVVARPDGRIVWVVGYRLDDRARVSDGACQAVQLVARPA